MSPNFLPCLFSHCWTILRLKHSCRVSPWTFFFLSTIKNVVLELSRIRLRIIGNSSKLKIKLPLKWWFRRSVQSLGYFSMAWTTYSHFKCHGFSFILCSIYFTEWSCETHVIRSIPHRSRLTGSRAVPFSSNLRFSWFYPIKFHRSLCFSRSNDGCIRDNETTWAAEGRIHLTSHR